MFHELHLERLALGDVRVLRDIGGQRVLVLLCKSTTQGNGLHCCDRHSIYSVPRAISPRFENVHLILY